MKRNKKYSSCLRVIFKSVLKVTSAWKYITFNPRDKSSRKFSWDSPHAHLSLSTGLEIYIVYIVISSSSSSAQLSLSLWNCESPGHFHIQTGEINEEVYCPTLDRILTKSTWTRWDEMRVSDYKLFQMECDGIECHLALVFSKFFSGKHQSSIFYSYFLI